MTRSRDVSAVQNNLGVAIPPAAAGKNAVINGGFDIWQRGTSTAGAAAYPNYVSDRWQGNRYGGTSGSTFSRQSSGYTGIQYSLRAQRDSGNTNTSLVQLSQSIETANSILFAGQTVTVSFYAKAGANYSSSGNGLSWKLVSGTGTNENYLTNGFTGQADVIFQSATLTTSWQRFSYTGTVGSTATQLALYFYYTPVGTASTNDYFEITGVQLELGSSATPFSRNGATIQGELAACQRYYFRTSTAQGNTGQSAFGVSTSTTSVRYYSILPVTMRISPSTIEFSSVSVFDLSANTTYAISAVANDVNITSPNVAYFVATCATMTSGRTVGILANAGTGYMGFSAEL